MLGAPVNNSAGVRMAGTCYGVGDMKLDEIQTKKVAAWIDEGMKLSDIQKRLESELGLKFTYLEVRFLVDDLKLKPKDPVPPPAPVTATAAAAPAEAATPVGTGAVNVTVDALTRPGAMVSGKVKFSDGKTAEWFMDQNGRLGLAGVEKGYKPTDTDVQEFQLQLQAELQKLGM